MSLDHLAPRDGTISIITSKDSSIRCSDEIYQEEYLLTLDESLLNLDPDVQPCRFVLKRILNHKEHLIVEKSKTSIGKKGKLSFNLSFQMEDVRQALVKIEEPESTVSKLSYKMGPDGKVDQEFITWLNQVGLLTDLYSARQSAMETKQGETGPLKKSSKLS